MEMNITPFTKAFSVNSKTQGALALAPNVANNPMLQFAKSSGITQFRDFGFRKEVIICLIHSMVL